MQAAAPSEVRAPDGERPAPPAFQLDAGLRRQARRASFWSTIAWNVLGPNRSRSVFVLGPPRTGTNWFARIVSHYFDLPRYIPDHHRLPMLRPAVLHLHRFVIVPHRTVYVVRDPRDVAVSYYHKIANIASPALRERITRALPLPYEHEHVRANLAAWIRLIYETNVGGAMAFHRHVERARALGLHTIRYEDLLERGEGTVSGAVAHLTGAPADPARVRRALEETSFEKRTGRKRGEQDLRWASVRKGIAGDWRNHFDESAAEAFQRCDPESLVALGYERDASWVAQVGSETRSA